MIQDIAEQEAAASAADPARETIPPGAAVEIAKVLVGAEVEARVVAALTKKRSSKSHPFTINGKKVLPGSYKPATVQAVAAAVFAVLRGGR